MPSSSRSPFSAFSLLLRRIAHSIARPVAGAERRLLSFWQHTPPRRRFARITGIVLFACMTLVTMADNGCGACKTNDIASGPGPVILTNYILGLAGVHYHTSLRPQFTGTDNSQTGTATFLGNLTSITQPTSTYFAMLRMSDCSLALVTATSPLDGTFALNSTANTNYEQTLHQLAGLKTTPDVFANGCKEGTTDLSARVAVNAGVTKSNIAVLATAESNGTNNAVFVLTSNADQSSVTVKPIPGTNSATALVTADLDGDGSGDLVAVNAYNATSSYVTVMLGNADGSFKTPVNYTTAGNYSVTATLDDIDGDGKLDIVSVSADQQISILTGKGDGTFNAAQSFAAPALPGSALPAASTPITNIITADVNGDGKRDLVCSNGLVLLGNGAGSFTAVAAAAFPYTSGATTAGPFIAAGDLDKDGHVDLVLDNGTTITTWKGKGDGTFTAANSYATINNTGYITVVDLDGDGNLDLYTGLADGGLYSGDNSKNASAYVLMGNGDGTFVGAPSINTGAYTGNNLGDVNGDGVPDLITNGPINSQTAAFTVSLGNGKGGFTAASTITAPASFTGTTSALTSPVTINNANTAAAASYAVADVNGDGKADLVFVDNGLTATNPSNNQPITYPAPIYFVALNHGDGTFASPVPYNFPQIAPASGFDVQVTATNLQIADFNHDGKADLIFTYDGQAGGTGTVPYYRGLVVLLGIGNGTFSTTGILISTYSGSTAPTTALLPGVVSTTDLNADNKPDLIVINPTFSIATGAVTQLLTYIGNGDGTFKAPSTFGISANVYGVPVLADFDKDGKLDLAFLAETSSSQAELAIARGNGDGSFANASLLNLTGGDSIRSASLAAADFDADGKIDLALFENSAFSGIFYGKGDGTFTSVPASNYVVPKDLINLNTGGAAIAIDLNKDTKPDILAGSTVLLNLYGSAPSVTTPTTTALTATATTVTVGASITFTATITPSSVTTAPTGTVTFMDGSATLCSAASVSSSKATCTTSALTVGSHSITAAYSGDATYSSSSATALSVTVTAATKTTPTVTVSPSPTSLLTTQALSVGVTVSGSPTPTGTVMLNNGATVLGTGQLTNGSATLALPAGSFVAGTYTLTANYTPDSSSASIYNSASGTASVTVTTPPSGFTLTAAPTSLSFAAAATSGNTSAITVTQVGAFTGSVTLACAITSTPPGATSPVTCSMSSVTPVTVPGGVTNTAAIVTTATTTPGAYTVTVTGTSGATTATTTISVTVTAPVSTPAITLTNGGSINIPVPGLTGSSTITVTPSGGFTGSVALTAALTSSPVGASFPPTLSFGSTTPVSITGATAGTATLTVSTTAATSALAYPEHPRGRWYATGGTALACVLLFGIRTRRRSLRTLFGILISLGIAGGIAGCSSGHANSSGGSGTPGTTAGSYTVTVTATSGTTTAQTTVAVTVI